MMSMVRVLCARTGLIGYHRMLSRQWVLLKDYRDSRRQALASGLRVDEDNLPAEHLAILSELEIRAMESIAKVRTYLSTAPADLHLHRTRAPVQCMLWLTV